MSTQRRTLPVRWIQTALVLVLLAAMALDTTWRSDSAPAPTGQEEFDPKAYAEDLYESRVVPTVQEKAVPLADVLAAFEVDPDAAGEKYGHRPGTSGSYNFAVEVTGVAGATDGSLMALEAEGVPEDSRVSIQVGPAINGTALRDVVGFIEFGDFINQVEYAAAATALNTKVKQTVLADVDPAQLKGQSVHVVGAVTLLTAGTVTITPVVLEPAS